MAEALSLAERGRGAVEPNPPVGAVIVRDGRVIAGGYHRCFGGLHAEVDALTAAQEAGSDVRGSTMYVTLEPCCHWGKTPPCTDAMIAAGIGRVVAALTDPDERVAGQGLEILKQAGVHVTVGPGAAQARRLLRGYLKLRTRRRPWVIAKWAQTAEGYLALPAGEGKWVSSEASRAMVHELRGECDGIAVGVGTVLADDPMLTNRSGAGRQPVRLVLDCSLHTPGDSQLVRTAKQWPLLVATTAGAIADRPEQALALQEAGAELVAMPANEGRIDLNALLDELGRREWTYLLVEGGQSVLEALFEAGLADEAMVFVSPRRVGEGLELPRFDVSGAITAKEWGQPERQSVGDDELLRHIRTDAM